MKSKLLLIILCAAIILSASSVYAAANFSDLPETHWAFRSVSTLVERGGITGCPDGTFNPSGTITIAEFIKIAVGSTLGDAEPSNSHWASGYFDKAIEANILESSELIQPDWDKAITRQQIAVIISRILDIVLGEYIAVPDRDEIIEKITDFNAVCPACRDSVIKVYSAGIITGYDDGNFNGGNTATRAEASTMIVRMLDTSFRVVK